MRSVGPASVIRPRPNSSRHMEFGLSLSPLERASRCLGFRTRTSIELQGYVEEMQQAADAGDAHA